MAVFLVMLGGGLGALSRYQLTLLFEQFKYPYATLIVNILGSFILVMLGLKASICLTWLCNQYPNLAIINDKNYQILLGTGFCGALTTYSTFNKESLLMIQQGLYLKMLIYIFAMLSLCLLSGLLAFYLFKDSQN